MLEGTLEDLPAAGVLRVLADTNKSGAVHFTGAVDCTAWFAEGRLGPVQPGPAVETLADLMTTNEGTFRFEPGAATEEGPDGLRDVRSVLADAEARIREVARIKAVVPTGSCGAALTAGPEARRDDVVLDRERWSAVVELRGATTVEELAGRLDRTWLDAAALVAELVDEGLATVTPVEPEPQPTLAPVELTTASELTQAPEAEPIGPAPEDRRPPPATALPASGRALCRSDNGAPSTHPGGDGGSSRGEARLAPSKEDLHPNAQFMGDLYTRFIDEPEVQEPAKKRRRRFRG